MTNNLQPLSARRDAGILIGCLLTVLTLAGCGYSFAGRSDTFPKDIRSVYIEPFIDQTREVGLGQEITSALRSEFYRRGQLQLVDRIDEADGIITGVIRSFESHVATVNREDEVLQYETAMVADASLRRRQPNEIIWRTLGTRLTDIYGGSRAAVVTTSAEFKSGTLNAADIRRMTDIQLTETESRAARDQLIERFARDLHQRILEMF